MDKTLQFGKYQLLERVAVGGMAELFLGKITGDQGFEKLVAIKCILPQFCAQPEVVDAFIDEAKLAAFLQHENIVQIYDFGCMGDRYFMAMEYLFGKDLRQIIDRCGQGNPPLTLDHALQIVLRVCSGLEYAHNLTDYKGQALHMVHRDVSPQNIFISYSGLVKILDFGVAKAAGRSSSTQSGVIKGKAAYMSPEQATGKTVDKRSDIFALGILLYELVTGKRMFHGEPLQVLEKVRLARYVPTESLAPGLSPGLYRIIDRALARRPEDRYPDCGEMHTDLEDCIKELPERSDTRRLGRFVRAHFEKEMHSEDRALKKMMPHAHTSIPEATPAGGLEGRAASDLTVTMMTAANAADRKGRPKYLLATALLTACVFIGLGVYVLLSNKSSGVSDHSRFDGYAIRREATAGTSTPNVLLSSEPVDETDPVFLVLKQAAALTDTDPGKAVEVLKKGLERAPEDPRLLFQLGLAHVRVSAYPRAIEVFTRLMEIDPNLYNAVFNLAFAYSQSGDYTKAERFYLQAVDMAPPYLDEVLYNLAMVQERLGKKKMAVRQLELAVKFNPHNIQAINYLYRLRGKESPSK